MGRRILMCGALLLGILPSATILSAGPQVEENKTVARQFFEDLWSQGNLELGYRIVASSFQFHSPAMRIIGPTGPDLVTNRVERMRGSFSDYKITIDDLFGEGDKVAVRWTASGTHDGKLGDKDPTGTKISYEGTSILQIQGGKVYQEWTIDGFTGVLRQLGIEQLRIRN